MKKIKMCFKARGDKIPAYEIQITRELIIYGEWEKGVLGTGIQFLYEKEDKVIW